MVEYILTLNSEQARELLKVIELMERWKLKQPDILSHMLVQDIMSEDVNTYISRKAAVEYYLKHAMNAWKPDDPSYTSKLKDDEWYLLYNITQVLRYAIHEAEHPNTIGVDSYPPLQMGGQPIPKCEWRKDVQDTK